MGSDGHHAATFRVADGDLRVLHRQQNENDQGERNEERRVNPGGAEQDARRVVDGRADVGENHGPAQEWPQPLGQALPVTPRMPSRGWAGIGGRHHGRIVPPHRAVIVCDGRSGAAAGDASPAACPRGGEASPAFGARVRR